MIVRVRSRVGTWRIKVSDNATVSDLVGLVLNEHGVTLTSLSLKPSGGDELIGLSASKLASLDVSNGTMMHVDFTGTPVVSGQAHTKSIDTAGNVIAKPKTTTSASFRPGIHALRNQKLHWTLTDMVELDDQYTFNIKAEKRNFSAQASLDIPSCTNFVASVSGVAFQRPRCGLMYGTFVDNADKQKSAALAQERKRKEKKKHDVLYNKKMNLSDLEELREDENADGIRGVKVEAFYEPPQTQETAGGGGGGTDKNDTFVRLLDSDPMGPRVDQVAESLGLQRVGFVISHGKRDGYVFSTHELISAGHALLEATDGALDSPFVIVKVFPDESNGGVAFDAFSLTPQCIEMIAEDALVPMPNNPGHSAVHETFTAVVEGKHASVIDNDFFIRRVAIVNHTGPLGGNGQFPRFNRDLTQEPRDSDIRDALKGLPRNASPSVLANKLADFHLLLYLATKFQDDQQALTEICGFVRTHVMMNETPVGAKDGSSSSAAVLIDDDDDDDDDAMDDDSSGRVGSATKRRSGGNSTGGGRKDKKKSSRKRDGSEAKSASASTAAQANAAAPPAVPEVEPVPELGEGYRMMILSMAGLEI